MQKEQQPKVVVGVETTVEERAEERRERRLRIDALEARVAPNAFWGE